MKEKYFTQNDHQNSVTGISLYYNIYFFPMFNQVYFVKCKKQSFTVFYVRKQTLPYFVWCHRFHLQDVALKQTMEFSFKCFLMTQSLICSLKQTNFIFEAKQDHPAGCNCQSYQVVMNDYLFSLILILVIQWKQYLRIIVILWSTKYLPENLFSILKGVCRTRSNI